MHAPLGNILLCNGIEIGNTHWIPNNFIAIKRPNQWLLFDIRDETDIKVQRISLGVDILETLQYPET